MFKFNKWPIKLIIHKVRADGGLRIETDKARRIEKPSGEVEWRRRTKNELLPEIAYKDLADNDVVELWQDKMGQYGKAKFDKGDAKIKAINTDVTNWGLHKIEEKRKKYENPSFLSKYGGTLVGIGLIIAFGVAIWTGFDKILEMHTISTNMAAQLKDALAQMVATCA